MRSLPAIFIILLALSRSSFLSHSHGTVVVDKCPAKADIVLILDASARVGYEHYKKELQFAADLTKSFNIGEDDFRFGAVIFSNIAARLFDLRDNDSHESLESAILRAVYMGSTVNTDKAFQKILDLYMFFIRSGGRPDSSRIVIVMTGGISQNTSLTLEAASKLKESEVNIIAIGIGQFPQTELRGMASSDKYVFTADNVDNLKVLEKKVAELICQVADKKAGQSDVKQLIEAVRHQRKDINDLKKSVDMSIASHSSQENTLSQLSASLENIANKQREVRDTLTNLMMSLTSIYNQTFASDKLLAISLLFNVSSEYNGKYYLLSKYMNIDLMHSQILCGQYGGYLAEIDDGEEQEFISNFMNTQSVRYALIGLTDEGHEDRWVWLTNQRPASYTNWSDKYPKSDTNYNCAWLDKIDNCEWYNDSCDDKDNFLCEVPKF